MADASIPALLLRLVVSMGVVIGLMLLAARVLRRSSASMGGGGRKTKRTPINLAALQPLTKSAHVAVVRAAGRELVLGVTDHQVTLLHSAIEPRDDLVDLDVETTTTSQPLDPDALASGSNDAPVTRARIAPVTGAAENASAEHPLTAWTDALEMLRAKTVRR